MIQKEDKGLSSHLYFSLEAFNEEMCSHTSNLTEEPIQCKTDKDRIDLMFLVPLMSGETLLPVSPCPQITMKGEHVLEV